MSSLELFNEYLRQCYVGTHWSVPAVLTGEYDLDHQLTQLGLRASFVGWSPEGEWVAIIEDPRIGPPRAVPSSFRVVAIVPTFNEADVIGSTLRDLVDNGIDVYVIDNWSTDDTLDIVREFAGRSLLGWERFPSQAAADTYDLSAIMRRVEVLATELEADWCVLHDADERRRGPWPELGLRETLYHVDRQDFTCIDHVTLTFWPIDNDFDPRQHDLEAYFQHFEFSRHSGHFHQRRAWKNFGQPVALAGSAGHDVIFEGRRVYPFKFLLKHFPIRSQAHGERKVRQERQARWNQYERSLGWHQQYDDLADNFVRRPDDLEFFEPLIFYERRLLERLSGVGVFDRPPEWATAPAWRSRTAA